MNRIWMGLVLTTLLAPTLAMSGSPVAACKDCEQPAFAGPAMPAPAWQGPAARAEVAAQQLHTQLMRSRFGRLRPDHGQAFITGEPVKERPGHSQRLTAAGDWDNTLETCGPGDLGDWLVPDIGEGMELACESHDVCYAEGGSESDREACDERLFLDLVSFGAPIEMAAAFYLGVRTAGMWFFNYRGVSSWNDPLAGCAYLEVCD